MEKRLEKRIERCAEIMLIVFHRLVIIRLTNNVSAEHARIHIYG